MEKNLSALGFMSGTSGDGVDTSVISSNGKDIVNIKYNRFDPYPTILSNKIHSVKENISERQDILRYLSDIEELEIEVTNFHADIANKINKEIDFDLIGFHGHTIYHNSDEKISKQIGLGIDLSKITKKNVVYDFRQEDIKNGGEGAPLSPIYHLALIKELYSENKVKLPISILNIGGIANITEIDKDFEIMSRDIGPGNCLIDNWVRKNSTLKYDENGKIASLGRLNELTLNQAIDNFEFNDFKNSLDINDFDISFLRGLDFEEGCATVTEFTAYLIANGINNLRDKNDDLDLFIFCGGGRKNNFLIKRIENYINNDQDFILKNIDDYNLDGDFIESQAFGYLAARSIYNLPISFPKTTRCLKSISGGEIVDNN